MLTRKLRVERERPDTLLESEGLGEGMAAQEGTTWSHPEFPGEQKLEIARGGQQTLIIPEHRKTYCILPWQRGRNVSWASLGVSYH